MSTGIINELSFFWQSMLWGCLMLVVYDLLRIFRRVVRHGSIFIALEDIVYWIAGGIFIFWMLYRENDGALRGFSILAMVLGMLIYNFSISLFFVNYVSAGILAVLGVIGKIIGFILRPFRWILGKTVKSGKKAASRSKKLTKYKLKRLKKRIKEFRISLYNH